MGVLRMNNAGISTTYIDSHLLRQNQLRIYWRFALNLLFLFFAFFWSRPASAILCEVPASFATIQAAVNDLNCSEINVAAGIYPDTINVGRDLTINGVGQNTNNPVTSIRNQISILNSAVLTLQNLAVEFAGNRGIVLGGGSPQLLADNIRVSMNTIGIDLDFGASASMVSLSNSVVELNQLGIIAANLTLDSSRVSSNSPGGGVELLISGLITNSTISGNVRSDGSDGGGILFAEAIQGTAGTLDILDSNISGNAAFGSDANNQTGDGGGIAFRNGTLNILRTTLVGNVAGKRGGGIHAENPFTLLNLSLSSSTLDGNVSYAKGGGIYSTESLNITASSFLNNRAEETPLVNINGVPQGGGLYISGDGAGNNILSIRDSEFRNNSSLESSGVNLADGGGVYFGGSFQPDSTVPVMDRVTFDGNFASINGGGIYSNAASTPLLVNVTLANNRANKSGGAVFSSTGIQLSHSTVVFNTADDDWVTGVGDGNGGGLSGQVFLNFSLIGHNTDKSLNPNRFRDCEGSVASTAYSIIRSNTGCSSTFDSGPGNQAGSDAALLGLKIRQLADNGGLTRTIALGLNSPALDSGTTSCGTNAGNTVSFDQRGSPHINMDGNNDGGADGDKCDIGAFEVFSTGCQVNPIVITEYTYTGVPQDNVLSKNSVSTVGNVTVGPSADVYFTSSNFVHLGAGFTVESGGQFLAEITQVNCP